MISEIRNGVPWTKGDEALITELSKEEQSQVLDWIEDNILPRKTAYEGVSSYGLKHTLTHDTGIYLTNNQFKHAMLLAGFEPVRPYMLNWHYCISKKSKAFDYKSRGYIA